MAEGVSVRVVPAGDEQAGRAKQLVQGTALLSWVMLFEGDRWSHVEYVAVASAAGGPVGLASLAPTDEEGQGGPHIIGVWVHPSFRRRGVGLQLLQALSEASERYYGARPIVVGVTGAGNLLIQAAGARGIPLLPRTPGLAGLDLP